MKIIVDVHSAISDKLPWIPFSNLTSAAWLQLSSCFSSKATRDWIYRFISDPSPFCIHTCQLSRIIRESPTYDTNLPVSRTGHHISRIKSSLEFFCALVWDLAHFSSKLEFFLFVVRFLGHFCTYLVTDKDYFWHQRWSRILMVCTSRETSHNHPWVSEWVSRGGNLRASSPIWASEASLATTRERVVKPRGAEDSFPRPLARAFSRDSLRSPK